MTRPGTSGATGPPLLSSLYSSNLAAIHAGGFATGIYQTNTAAACEYIARDSRANIVVVGDHDQLAKVLLPASRNSTFLSRC